jgi:hypothetical protein
VLKKLNQLIALALGTKFMMWAIPDSKRFLKGILITLVIVLLSIYFQKEYLSWSAISGNSKFIIQSYILKNLIILVSIICLYFYLKKPPKKVYKKIPGEEKIYTKNNNEDYFDKFRNKEKLRTKGQQILEKDDKN